MQNVNALIGAQGPRSRTASSTTRSAAPRGPRSSPASTPTTTACWSNQPPRMAAFRPLRVAAREQQPRGVAAARRLLHRADRQVPEPVREQAARPAGLVGVARRRARRADDSRLRLHAQRQRRADALRQTARPTSSRTSSRGRRSTSSTAAPRSRSPSSCGSPTRRRTSAARTRIRNPPSDCDDAAEAPAALRARLRLRAAADAARTSTRPTSPTSRPPSATCPCLTTAQIADIQRKYRCELESLLAVDDGVKKVIDALQAKGELDNTLIIYTSDNGYFHGEHRIPRARARIYEESIRVPLEMRGPGIPQGVTHRPPGDQRRPGADDRRGGAGVTPRPRSWTAVRCSR